VQVERENAADHLRFGAGPYLVLALSADCFACQPSVATIDELILPSCTEHLWTWAPPHGCVDQAVVSPDSKSSRKSSEEPVTSVLSWSLVSSGSQSWL